MNEQNSSDVLYVVHSVVVMIDGRKKKGGDGVWI